MEKKIKNKRKGPDQISRTISLIIAISWVLIFILFIILALAKPTADWSITSIMSQNTQFSGGWNRSFIQILPPVLIVQVGLCVFGLLLSSRRMKRKSDKYSTSLIFFTITSIAGLLVYLV
ncbi:MAG: hypothetical protein FWG92_01950, partial [Leptospirales bacterium]|nr:hypothetical protein [Leptospirales bacterium]